MKQINTITEKNYYKIKVIEIKEFMIKLYEETGEVGYVINTIHKIEDINEIHNVNFHVNGNQLMTFQGVGVIHVEMIKIYNN